MSDTNSTATLATLIARWFYRVRPTDAVPLPSLDNDLFRIEFGGLPPKVVKLYRQVQRGRREQHVLAALRQPRFGLAVPGVEFTQEDFSEPLIHNRTFSVMRHEPEMTLKDAILRGERWAGDAMRAAGAFAASTVPAVSVLPRARRHEPSDQAQRVIGRLATGEPRVDAMLQRVAEMKQTPADRLIHGEFVPENVLCNEDGICVADWETARAGWCVSDLAQLTASLARLGLRDGDVAELRRRAADGFFARRAEDTEEDWTAWETYWLLSARCAAHR